jgi:hypothetical protein
MPEAMQICLLDLVMSVWVRLCVSYCERGKLLLDHSNKLTKAAPAAAVLVAAAAVLVAVGP